MEIREINVKANMEGFGVPNPISGVLFGGEDQAHKFIVADQSGEAFAGTVSAKFLRYADDQTVPLTGSIEDGKATVTLIENCYYLPGRFKLTIYVTSGGSTTAVYCCMGSVDRTDGRTTVDPSGEINLDVTDLINRINAAVGSIPPEYTALLNTIAPNFSTSAAYKAGEYVWNGGTLYRFTTDHAAGAWVGTDATAAVIGEDLAGLKNTIDEIVYGVDVTHTVSATGTQIFDCLIVNGGRYTFTNNTSGTCTLNLRRADGTTKSVKGQVNAGASYTFVADEDDFVGIRSYANGTGTMTLVSDVSLSDVVAGWSDVSAKTTVLDRAAGNLNGIIYTSSGVAHSYADHGSDGGIAYTIGATSFAIRIYTAQGRVSTSIYFADVDEDISDYITINEASVVIVLNRYSKTLVYNTTDGLLHIRDLMTGGWQHADDILLIANAYAAPVGGVFFREYMDRQNLKNKADIATNQTQIAGKASTTALNAETSRAQAKETEISGSVSALQAQVDALSDRVENLPTVFTLSSASTSSRQFEYEFRAGHNYEVTNKTTATITFQTRETKTGPTIDNLGSIAANASKTLECTTDAYWFNSWSPDTGSIEIHDLTNPYAMDSLSAADIFNAEPYTGDYDWQTPVVEYGALFKGKDRVEAFAYFTDPHVLGFGDSDRNEVAMRNYLKRVQTTYNQTPCSYIVSGGDWLNNATTMDEACYRLGLLKGVADHLLSGMKIVVGNHDTNYQGKETSDSERNTGQLTNATIAAIMFRETDTKKAYYSFDGDRAKCYVLDTGIDWNHGSVMNAYDWEQLAWLAGKLGEDNPEHAIIFMHILRGTEDVTTPATTFGTLVEAYNAHTSVTLNGSTYDFTSCSGHVDFWVAGHNHRDINGTLGGIPYFITKSNGYSSDVPLIDLALVDYDNNVLYLKRVGETGGDRTISLTTGQLITE